MALRDSTILITGGTSGIGRALAGELTRSGNTVIVCGRRQDRLAEVRAEHPGIVTYPCDLSTAGERQRLVDLVVSEHPALNVLINNAGVQLRFDVTRPADPARLQQEVDINLVAPAHLSSLLAGQLAGRPGATIVNVSSGLAFAPLADVGLYSATKAAVHSLTLTMRHQLKGIGIRVIELVPPAVDTELGVDRREDPTATHGGMAIDEFVAHTVAGLESGVDEITVGVASRLRAAPEEMFTVMNR